MPDVVRIQGATYSWSSVRSTLGGVDFQGFNEVGWDEKLTRGFGYGAGRHHAPRERTAGVYEPSPLKLNVLASSEDSFNQILLDALTEAGYTGSASIGKAEVVFFVEYDEPLLGPVSLRAIGASLQSRGQALKQGPDIFVIPVEFSVMRYVRTINGVDTTLWDSDETGAA